MLTFRKLVLIVFIIGSYYRSHIDAQAQLVPADYIFKPGPSVKATKGEVLPKPQQEKKSDDYFILDPLSFTFRVIGSNCVILTEALLRYWDIISRAKLIDPRFLEPENNSHHSDLNYKGYLTELQVQLTGVCDDDEYPFLGMQENYELSVSSVVQKLSAPSIWGILRGLETFSQLVYRSPDFRNLFINATEITDYPRFPHRGFSLDTARHYQSKDCILKFIDILAYHKFNVFHWHLSDDQSFPFVSKTYPELSEKGAYHRSMVYEPSFVKDVILHAKQRGIRVIPEFDTPGHTLSWGLGNPDLLTPCYKPGTAKLTGGNGPIDPTKNSTYEFLYPFFDEIKEVFADQCLHLGGDEVDFSCWESNPDIRAFMAANNLGDDYPGLQSYFEQKIIDYVTSINRSSIVWEEVFTNGVAIPRSTLVHVWIANTYRAILNEVTAAGHPAILSGCWYLDQLANGGDWAKFFMCDALESVPTEEQRQLVLGGEACMWSEVVDETNFESRIWPRASTIAERLWSAYPDQLTSNGPYDTINVLWEAARRLEEHTCRLRNRGVRAQPPTAAGFCYD